MSAVTALKVPAIADTTAGMTAIKQMTMAHLTTVVDFFDEVAAGLDDLADTVSSCISNGGKVLLCGNGGSAADAQHIAAEFVGRFVNDRPSLASIALTTDTSILTAVGNDYGYDEVFSRQVEGLGRPGDILIGITTSGNSANVLRAFEVAKKMGITSVALTGKTGGQAKTAADVSFTVTTPETARIQECHIMFLHMLCALVEDRLGY